MKISGDFVRDMEFLTFVCVFANTLGRFRVNALPHERGNLAAALRLILNEIKFSASELQGLNSC